MLTAAEAAEKLHVSPQLIYSACRRGEITHYRFGRTVRIEEADLDSYVAAKKTLLVPIAPPPPRPKGMASEGFTFLRRAGWKPPEGKKLVVN